jgi:hypothetical protein
MTGRYAQQQIKERNRRVLRKHWWRFGVMALALVGVASSIWLIVPRFEVPLWAVIPAMFLGATGAAWDQLAGTYHLVSGRDAEKWTSKELRKACGPGWHVVDGVSFAFHDVDHVLVGPGGIFAIETKYTDSSVDLGSRRGQELAKRWAEQAIQGALSIRYCLWHETRQPIVPLVIVWGSEVSGSPRLVAGVPILRRKDLNDSMPWQRNAAVLSGDQVRAIVASLEKHQAMRLIHERTAA